MHPASVSANKTEQEWLDIMVRYSRMHWGRWWEPLRWRCELSYRWHDPVLHARAARHAAAAGRSLAGRPYAATAVEVAKTGALSPRVAWHRCVLPVARRGRHRWRGAPATGEGDALGRYSDAWIGPVYRADLSVPAAASRLVVRLEHAPPDGAPRRIRPRLLL